MNNYILNDHQLMNRKDRETLKTSKAPLTALYTLERKELHPTNTQM